MKNSMRVLSENELEMINGGLFSNPPSNSGSLGISLLLGVNVNLSAVSNTIQAVTEPVLTELGGITDSVVGGITDSVVGAPLQ